MSDNSTSPSNTSSNRRAAQQANTRALIARIPDEILQGIFYLCSEWPICFPLAYSQVCLYWRDLALATPTLWTFIYFTNRSHIKRLREFLVRSGDSLLHIKFSQYGVATTTSGDLHDKALLISDHSHRICEFQAEELYQPQMTTLFSYFSSPAPQLRYLRLQGTWQLASAPLTLFRNQIPLLRRLSLHNITTQWLSCKDLAVLDLCSFDAPSWAVLFQTLRDSSALTHLTLQFRTPLVITAGNSHDDPALAEAIELSSLRRLSLGAFEHRDVISILSNLSFPPTTVVDLRFKGARRSPIHILRDSPSLRAIVAELDHVVLVLSSSPWLCEIALECGEQLSVRWEWQWTEEIIDDRDFLRHVGFAAIPFPALRHLDIRVLSFQMYEAEWRALLGHVPTAKSITLEAQKYQVFSFFVALSQPHLVPPPDTEGAGAIVCPNLTHFTAQNFDDEREWNFEQVVLCMEARAAQRARLRCLAIIMRSGKPLPSTLLSRAEAVVENVHVFVPPDVDSVCSR